jgi:uncharacterized protein YodC (DUF2158 family)
MAPTPPKKANAGSDFPVDRTKPEESEGPDGGDPAVGDADGTARSSYDSLHDVADLDDEDDDVFEVGDVVQLRSGGPPMVVEEFKKQAVGKADGVNVFWMSPQHPGVQKQVLPVTILERVPGKKQSRAKAKGKK